ncbi:MAG: hypothetical protein QM696_08625 [Steroidobacteraceae bacterium]
MSAAVDQALSKAPPVSVIQRRALRICDQIHDIRAGLEILAERLYHNQELNESECEGEYIRRMAKSSSERLDALCGLLDVIHLPQKETQS